jgi:hypothetical protein
MYSVEEQMAQENSSGYEKEYVDVNHELDTKNKLVVSNEPSQKFYEEAVDDNQTDENLGNSQEYGYDKGDLLLIKEHEETKTVTKAKKGVTKKTYFELIFGGGFLMFCTGALPFFYNNCSDALLSYMLVAFKWIGILISLPLFMFGMLDIFRLYVPGIDELLSKNNKEGVGSFGPRLTEEVVEKKVIREEEQFKVKMPAELYGHTIETNKASGDYCENKPEKFVWNDNENSFKKEA